MAEMPEATTAPDALCCPISMEIMRDPVMAADGHTYERADIESWFANNRTSPKTGAVLPHCSLIPNHAVKAMISDFHDEARRRQAALDEDEDDDEALPAAHEEEGDAGADDANADGNASPRAPERRRSTRPTTVADEDGGARTTSSRFWGVSWSQKSKKWRATYKDADGKLHHIGMYEDEEEAARAVNKAIRDAGLEGQRRTNAVDATGALVPKSGAHNARDRSAVVAPDAARAPSATTSKFWGVSWNKHERRWKAAYTDANGKRRGLGYFDTQEQAAHAVNAAIRRAGLAGKRKTNPVVDGQLVPPRKRRRDEPAATPSPRARRPRRAVNYVDSEPDDGSDSD